MLFSSICFARQKSNFIELVKKPIDDGCAFEMILLVHLPRWGLSASSQNLLCLFGNMLKMKVATSLQVQQYVKEKRHSDSHSHLLIHSILL